MSENINPTDLDKTEEPKGIRSVAGKKKVKEDLSQTISKYLLWIVLSIGVIVLAYALMAMNGANASSENQDPDRKHLRAEDLTSSKALTVPALPPKVDEEDEKSQVALDLDDNSAANPATQIVSNTMPKENNNLTPLGAEGYSGNYANNGVVEKDEMSLEDLKFAAPMMGKVENSSTSADLRAMQDVTASGLQYASSDSQNKGNGPLGDKLNPVRTSDGTTRKISHPSLTLNKGTVVECILETRVDTSVPGMTSCIIPRDVYSSNGRVLLIEKGTKVVGEYQGAVQNGLERIFMLWTEMRTPESVIVSLNSPAADALGGAGFDGYVDHHWWKRFGNALLFSMVADGFDYAITTAQSNSSNSNVTYNNSEKGVNEIIKAAMEQSGNIPPTLIKNPGERVSIFVARDVDFSAVYELRKSQYSSSTQLVGQR